MKKIICKKPYKFVIEEDEMPVIQSNEALIRMRRIGICGTDIHAYKGDQPFFTYPRILGHEISGEVAKIHEDNKELSVGDRVMINPYNECGKCIACRQGYTNCCENLELFGVHRDGGMQEYFAVPISNLIQTNSISLEASAIVECLSIGAHAVRRAKLKKDETVLVIGAGPIGLGTMKFAHLEGANVIAMDINEERLTFSKEWAPTHYTVNVNDNPMEKILEITKGDLPTTVFDATGNKESMENAFQYVAFSGKLVYVSLIKDNISFFDPDFHKKEITLLSSRNATSYDIQTVLKAIDAGDVDTDKFVTHRASFNEMIEKFDSWLKPETGVIKAMVEL